MSDIEAYYYNHQLTKYLVQFMSIFADMQVMVGANATQPSRLIKVPIIYGSRDRVVASIKADNTQNKPLRVPTFSAFLRSLSQCPDKRKGIGQTRRQTVMPLGGQFPTDIQVVYQYMPVPYRARFELCVYASNTDQHFQIMEQLLLLFDPILQIQTSDDPMDWTQITEVEMTDINWEENFPAGADRRIIQSTLMFDTIIYLSPPANFKQNYIANIKVRLGVVPTTTNLNNSESIIEALDTEGIPYTDLFTLANVNIEKP
jgi:hypothetical protein